MTRLLSTPGAEDAAALWAARLDGSELSADDRQSLERWLAEDASHRVLLSAFCQLGADLEQSLGPWRSRSVPTAVLPRPRRKRLGWRRATLCGLAAAAAIAVLLAALPHRSQSTSLTSRIGERQAHTLADGTRLELNAQTAVAVRVTPSERRVRLASGQAFFAVRRDPGRPFFVETPQGSVRVTGTRFDVRAEAGAPLEVVVAEGSVQVSAHEAGGATGRPVALVGGQRYTGGPEPTIATLSAAALADALAWRQGQIVFEGVPLREALARFGRYHGRALTASSAAGELPVGGRFSLDDLDGFLAALEEIFPVEVSQNLNGTVLVRLRSAP